MGFTTGFLGGVTLTTTLLYLSLNLHTRNRIHQAALLHQQSLLLNTIVEPQPPLPPPIAREVRAGVWESAKDRWNAELENGVTKLQRTNWGDVREQMEEGVSRVWRRAFQGAEQGIEKAGVEAEKGLRRVEEETGKGYRRVEAEAGKGIQRLGGEAVKGLEVVEKEVKQRVGM